MPMPSLPETLTDFGIEKKGLQLTGLVIRLFFSFFCFDSTQPRFPHTHGEKNEVYF